MHVLAELRRSSLASGAPLFGNLTMFHATSGTTRLHAMLERSIGGDETGRELAQLRAKISL